MAWPRSSHGQKQPTRRRRRRWLGRARHTDRNSLQEEDDLDGLAALVTRTETAYNKKTTEMAWPRSSHGQKQPTRRRRPRWLGRARHTDRNSLQQEDDGDGLAALVTRTETAYNKKTTEMAWPRSSPGQKQPTTRRRPRWLGRARHTDRNSLQQEDDGDGLAALVTRTETAYNKKTTEMAWPRSSHRQKQPTTRRRRRWLGRARHTDRNSLQQEDDGDGLAALVTRTEIAYNKKTTEMAWPRSSPGQKQPTTRRRRRWLGRARHPDRNSLQQEDDGDGLAALVTFQALVISWCSLQNRLSPPCFHTSAGIPSPPGALPSFRQAIALAISSMVGVSPRLVLVTRCGMLSRAL